MKVLKCGDTIDLFRRKEDLTYGQLAAKSGVPEKTVERICEGANAPCVAHFLRLCRTLNIEKPLNVFAPEDFEQGGAA